jgi:hypothetical protein
MNDYVTIQIADTRFAVTCSYPPFMEFLTEKCSGFISPGEPHLKLNIGFNIVPQGCYDTPRLSIVRNGNHHQNDELLLSVAWSHPTNLFRLMIHICLRCAIAAKHPPDLLLHSAGVVREGMAYLFAGPSAAGKSTVCKLLASEPSVTILHDEIVAITRTGEGFNAWSTPLYGEMPAGCSIGAPLRAVFLLKHSQTNYATKLSRRKAAGQIALSLVPPYITTNGRLELEPPESLRLALTLAEVIPCYELHFRPEGDFWECIPQLFEKELATTLRKGQKYDG